MLCRPADQVGGLEVFTLIHPQYAASGNWHGLQIAPEHLPYMVGSGVFLAAAGKSLFVWRGQAAAATCTVSPQALLPSLEAATGVVAS